MQKPSRNSYIQDIKYFENILLEIKLKSETVRIQHEKDLQRFADQKAEAEVRIAQAESKIAACEEYRSYKDDKIPEMYFVFRCKNLNIDQPVN